MAVRELRERRRVEGRVRVVLGDEAPVLDGVLVPLGLLELHRLGSRESRRRRVPAVVCEELGVDAVGARGVVVLHLTRGEADRSVAGARHDELVPALAEALGEVALDGVGVHAVLLALLLVLGLDGQVEVGRGDVLDGAYGLLYLRVLRERGQIRRDGRLVVLRDELLVGLLELRRAHLGDLLGRDLRLDLRVVLLLCEGSDLLGEVAGRGGPRARLVLEEHRHRLVERALRAVALAVLSLRAEHVRLDLLVVALRLPLRLGQRLVPQHLGPQVHALGKRRLPKDAPRAVGVERDDLLVDLLELVAVVVDDHRRLGDVAAYLLDVRLHRHGAPEVERVRVRVEPQEPVDDLARRGERGVALLELLRLLLRVGHLDRVGDAQVEVDRLARDVAPRVLAGRQLREQRRVALGGLGVLPVADEELAVRVARLHVELADLGRRLLEHLEELVVDLHALGLLAAVEVVVGDL